MQSLPRDRVSISNFLHHYFWRLSYFSQWQRNLSFFSSHLSGNSQAVKRAYLGHKVILCNTLLWAPGPILMAPDGFYLINKLSGRMGIVFGGPNTASTCWYLPPQSRQLILQNPFIGPLAALTREANTSEHLLYLVPLFGSPFSQMMYLSSRNYLGPSRLVQEITVGCYIG